MVELYLHSLICLHDSVLNDLILANFPYSSPSIIRMIKSTRMRWAGHVARMGKRNAYRIFVAKPEEKREHLEYLGLPR
jgi:hypothetical protein